MSGGSGGGGGDSNMEASEMNENMMGSSNDVTICFPLRRCQVYTYVTLYVCKIIRRLY